MKTRLIKYVSKDGLTGLELASHFRGFISAIHRPLRVEWRSWSPNDELPESPPLENYRTYKYSHRSEVEGIEVLVYLEA